MDRDPGDIQNDATAKPVAEMSEDEFTAWLSALPPAPGIRHADEEDEEGDAQALADVAAGRVVPHEKVVEWLRTVGTPDHRPMPREWLE